MEGSDPESMASHASSGLGLSRRTGGYGQRASNRSFTLHTPPAHPASEDSLARASVRPHEISFVTTPRLLRTFVAVLALAVSGFAALVDREPGGRCDGVRQEGARRLVRQRPHRPPLSAQLLRGGDRRDPGRSPRLRRRRGRHHARAPGGAARRPRSRRGGPDSRRRRSHSSSGGNGSGGTAVRVEAAPAATRRQRRTSTRRARPRCRFPCSCWAECRSRCSPRAGSDTSRAAVTQLTADDSGRLRPARVEPLAASGGCATAGTMSASCVYAYLQGFLRRHLPSGSLPTIPCPLV